MIHNLRQVFFRFSLNYKINEQSFQLEIEVSVRADKLAAANTQIKIEFTTILVGDGVGQFKTDLTLNVVERTDSNLIPTNYTPAMKARDW